jgi:hypothetical protein
VTPDQLVLFAEAERNAERPLTRARGPKGLLLALVRRGLDPDALRAAAALVLELDSGAERCFGNGCSRCRRKAAA